MPMLPVQMDLASVNTSTSTSSSAHLRLVGPNGEELANVAKLKAKLALTFNKPVIATGILSVAIALAAYTEDAEGDLLDDEHLKWPYFVSHYLLALVFFNVSALIHHFGVTFCEFDGFLVAGLVSGELWYVSREVRDAEKLGYWDKKGLLSPTFGVGYTFVVVQLALLVYRWKIEKSCERISRYPLASLLIITIVNTVCSIVYRKEFEGAWD
jgi:hypothetical protein